MKKHQFWPKCLFSPITMRDRKYIEQIQLYVKLLFQHVFSNFFYQKR